MITCTKTYADVPFAHRQHRHAGHCALIHGHNWRITLTFACDTLDDNGFVVDFGRLRYLKDWIDAHLDHACVLAVDDPMLDSLRTALPDLFKLCLMRYASCEGVAMHLWEALAPRVHQQERGRVWLARVEVWEDTRNGTTFDPPAHMLEAVRRAATGPTVA